ncbi:CoA ester lyase [Acuticoccus sp. MNP-M23]|uniref:HpcH/HpaI aldolase/citrate lyase family protein n=1 Tax=Acuticoccus sp. MNP-M23 TaxID=3072793 RepID=UPI002815BEA7|nr:CoA ester lyase [Acuticoccus sp. MNP-M23]WMS42256.1 CoA ester lyase [Acuticoccus sp. MNP-M23]
MRSWLFVPADSERKIEKAFLTEADVVILDLEDSVAPVRKAFARDCALAARDMAPARTAIRINALDSGMVDADIATVAAAAPALVVLPKAEGGASVAELAARLAVAEAEAGLAEGAIGIMAIVTETASSLFQLGTYADSSTRLCAMGWGAEDLSTALGASRTRCADTRLTGAFALARTLTLAGAHAAAASPLDAVFTALGDNAGLKAECEAAAADGFLGKMSIHPAQVPIINTAFTPSAAAVNAAERIVAAFDAAPDAGVLSLDGKMVDRPHLANAQRLLARARALGV